MERLINEDKEHREVWFIYSPRQASWANIRIATFTKAVNAPHLELVVIHNEVGPRAGIRIWDDIRRSELWFKVKRIELPTFSDVMRAAMADDVEIDTSDIHEATEDWFRQAKLKTAPKD